MPEQTSVTETPPRLTDILGSDELLAIDMMLAGATSHIAQFCAEDE